ncbi:hypothetical protein PG996_008376 [Apiospora saccharicola]|uniref:Uncharacterized protein n=1 Tax=Apiospora saccharicola TaxID=335842 RepID=A0ABR1V0X1_9PEZI
MSIYSDSKGLYYSPTKYVELLCPKKEIGERTELISILRSARFTSRYYCESGDQPFGYCGLPPHIYERVKVEKMARLKHESELARQAQSAAQQAKATDEQHRKALEHQRELNHMTLAHQRKTDRMLQEAQDKSREAQLKAKEWDLKMTLSHEKAIAEHQITASRRLNEQTDQARTPVKRKETCKPA